MHYLVVFATDKGFVTINFHFKHFPPTIDEVEAIQKYVQKKVNLTEMPVIVNWLPLSEMEEEKYENDNRIS